MKSKADISLSVDLEGFEVLVCVCGGIAAYKVCHVVSDLVQRGAGVTVAMTQAATRFVGPLTFAALSGRPVLTSLWQQVPAGDMPHIDRTGAADLVLIAPATANIIGKAVAGIADEIVSTLILSADSPVLFAPAMNDRMWASDAVRGNMDTLKARGILTIGPAEGWLACRSVGPGRMVEAPDIIDVVSSTLRGRPSKASADQSSA